MIQTNADQGCQQSLQQHECCLQQVGHYLLRTISALKATCRLLHTTRLCIRRQQMIKQCLKSAALALPASCCDTMHTYLRCNVYRRAGAAAMPSPYPKHARMYATAGWLCKLASMRFGASHPRMHASPPVATLAAVRNNAAGPALAAQQTPRCACRLLLGMRRISTHLRARTSLPTATPAAACAGCQSTAHGSPQSCRPCCTPCTRTR